MSLLIEKSRTYSDEEVKHIFALARFFLEIGNYKNAQHIISGLCEIRPDFLPAWLAASYLGFVTDQVEGASHAARMALKVSPSSVEAHLLQIAGFLGTGDITGAGALLGEVNDMIENGQVREPAHLNFFRAQLARFQYMR